MSTYQQACPIALAAEFFAERWTPLILREIVLMGHYRFGEIHAALPRLSQTLLVERLHTLESFGVIERRPIRNGRGSEYRPTEAGAELLSVLDALGVWAQRWIELRREDCDPAYVMQTIHVLLREEHLPPSVVVVRFDFEPEARTYWLVLDRKGSELCFHDPGRDVDMLVTADVEALTRVILGRLRLADALTQGLVRLDGPALLIRSFPEWVGLSRYAPYATMASGVRLAALGTQPGII
jgi:DNA-binding HxlR family transcriptional regulator